ncbi:MAG: 30S ribosomal protein S20 [Candidatus Staskawiczbacteria bacterium RIFOXYC1_FULL_37_43]|nr:MAG: 30S ribosomal protein S20 [Candidatus Staskawiczbacteria bacterium RIFCSPHIGHO2_01_FULL_37_17]OGZ71611.1 MAG: 30S ribosomal protein S20 [Candidatus Staskawiczbacteria bacterium RIFCSPLOWO2_01_FULL_37_19]OGZ76365.1 MAG: 30S ribosomal protein S20 [Candidatus Staskawiczbacteria bacterium RIFOXYA1_FULL_37_15]OGZ77370.1 MAG: 30S ribosomal protein S20 [Candidatus Staskawiczbacteria bacterium RIFOXYA12_FULL_37_10]OGZ80381.1 MAG: 30S ribosomal protein S20 [Candidatus Staskawiczbacteria bacteriu
MAITKSAKKAIRQNERRKAINIIYKDKIKALLKEARSLVSAKKNKEAEALLPKLYRALDKAAKVGVIKKNNASRKKSRISKLVGKKA